MLPFRIWNVVKILHDLNKYLIKTSYLYSIFNPTQPSQVPLWMPLIIQSAITFENAFHLFTFINLITSKQIHCLRNINVCQRSVIFPKDDKFVHIFWNNMQSCNWHSKNKIKSGTLQLCCEQYLTWCWVVFLLCTWPPI